MVMPLSYGMALKRGRGGRVVGGGGRRRPGPGGGLGR